MASQKVAFCVPPSSRNALRITNAAAPLRSAAGTPSPTLYLLRPTSV